MKRGLRKRLVEAFMTVPSLGWLVLFFMVPTIFVALIAFRPHDVHDSLGVGIGFTLDSIRGAIDSDYPLIVWRTVWVSCASTAVCIALGVPMAYYMARISERARRWLLMLTVIPFWTSFIIRIFAWMQLLHTDGVLKHAFVALGLMRPEATLMYNMRAILLVMVYTSMPFAVLPLFSAAEKFDFNLVDAAQDLGATRFRALLSTFIPGIRSGILFAVLMVLIPNLGCYVASEIIGGPDCVLIGNRIKECALTFHNLPQACALSLFLMLGIGIAIFAGAAVIRIRGGKEALREIAQNSGGAL